MSKQQPKQPEPGMPCPSCKFFIKMPIAELLASPGFSCPGCGLRLSLDRNSSQKSMELLQDIHVAMRNAESVKKQNL
jgi:hypothetical protein